MNPKQPLIIIIWMYLEMMVWMSRKSTGIWDGWLMIFARKLGSFLSPFSLKYEPQIQTSMTSMLPCKKRIL
jgi:hypothetical protein